MSAIRLGSAANVRAFQALANELTTSEAGHTLDVESLQDEFGRFRVWSGNLGALQKGHSSLDYRLRDSPLLSSNVLKLLQELEQNLNAAFAIVSGARLPYEQQSKSEAGAQPDDDDDFFSEDEDDDSDNGAPKTELDMRYREVVDIVDNLYRLSVRIRGAKSLLGSRSLKAASYQPKDPETGVAILDQYATYDLQHIQELVRHLRSSHTQEANDESDILIDRLARAITLRRRQFKYWRRHRDKLGTTSIAEEPQVHPLIELPDAPARHDTLEVHLDEPTTAIIKNSPSQKTSKTLLSGTEATHHHQSLDDIVDSKSVTSYATTVRDITGKGIDLPPPPKAATEEKDFECPYCFIICPARYGRGRPWRTHVLQDLQPYVCTYSECETPDRLFRSRREWSEHEATHRKAWRCPEHPTAIYRTPGCLYDHLRQDHKGSLPENQIDSIVKVGETSTVDMRETCPICFASASMEGMGGLQNHLANHLERIAVFSLPKDADDDSEGNSQEASRGRSDSTASQNLSGVSFADDSSDAASEDIEPVQGSRASTLSVTEASFSDHTDTLPTKGLSEHLLRDLPDARSQRLNILFSDQTADSDDSEHDDDDIVEVAEHIAETEAFRTYLTTLPGAQSVQFYRRFGSWTGRIKFKDELAAINAVLIFDEGASQYPEIQLRLQTKNKSIVEFGLPQQGSVEGSDNRATGFHVERAESQSVSSGSVTYKDRDEKELASVLTISQIPTLRTLYRNGHLLQRDQSYVPSDAYNQIISFCTYDITRLKVDAIVNSANRSLKISKESWSLNHAVHKAAGHKLRRECKDIGKLDKGQAVLTGGYDLPSTYIIHAGRPHYTSHKSMGQYNTLSECYRNALKLAMNRGFKTIAFPSLGAGGCGFPPRVATRIALQEVREFLDSHKNHGFERIVFCMFEGIDSQSYNNYFPVFFPPTHGDLENVIPHETDRNRIALGTQMSDAYAQVQIISEEIVQFSMGAPAFPKHILEQLVGIMKALRTLCTLLLGSQGANAKLEGRVNSDVDLLSRVMQTFCGSVTEIVELAKGKANLGRPNNQAIWDDYNSHLKTSQGLDIVGLLEICQDFAQCLEDVLVRDSERPYELKTMSIRLSSWLLKQSGGGGQYVRDHFDEVMYTREYQRDAVIPNRTGVVKLHHIPSIARMYQVDALEQRPTNAIPSTRFNHMVCLLREDITRLEVDIIVNSTDVGFSGMGTLDRVVFRKGGPDMQEECAKFGICKEGDVRIGGGYLLPARHVLHVVPPETYRGKSSQDTLRNMYREILHMAVSLKATSVAIPSIGTGMLNYPRRDCASLAIEEVKRFLESMESSSMMIEKIIFVVYGSNDEFTFKSLIPVYFPPLDVNINKALPSDKAASTSSGTPLHWGPSEPPRRTLYGTVKDALRSVRFGKQSVTSDQRKLEPREEDALINFERHAHECLTCCDVNKVYLGNGTLCAEGYHSAQTILRYLYMEADQFVFSTTLEMGRRVCVEVPIDYSMCLELLSTVEKSFRDEDRSIPFVSPNRPWPGPVPWSQDEGKPPPGVTIHTADVTLPARREPERAYAYVQTFSDDKVTRSLAQDECLLEILDGKVCVYSGDTPQQAHTQGSLLSIELTPNVKITNSINSSIAIEGARTLLPSVVKNSGIVLLRCRGRMESEMLFQSLKHAAENNPTFVAYRSRQQQEPKPLDFGEEESGDNHSHDGDSNDLYEDLPPIPPHDPEDSHSRSTDANPSAAKDLRSRIQDLQEASASLSGIERDELPWSNVLGRRIVAYLKGLPQPYQGAKQQDLAAKLDVSLEDIKRVASHLQALNLVRTPVGIPDRIIATNPQDPSLPWDQQTPRQQSPTAKADEAHLSDAEQEPTRLRTTDENVDRLVSNLSTLNIDKQPRPRPRTTSPSRTERQLLDLSSTVNIDDYYYTYINDPGATATQGTVIDRRIVNSEALTEAGESFKENEDNLTVPRRLTHEDVLTLVERTREMRRGRGGIGALAAGWVESGRGKRVSRGEDDRWDFEREAGPGAEGKK